jgi:cytidyltransferase-like protein
MKKFVVMSGGFHPFHAGHASLYQQAKEKFPDATVLVCATNVQSDRPFPFSLKKKLAQLSGVPPKDFIEVGRQFSIEDPGVASRIGDPNKAVVIFVRSEKDKNEPPIPWRLGPDGKPPVGKKGQPLSNRLLDYPSDGQPLYTASKHVYMDYLKTVEFGPGITSASQIREKWPTLNDKRKTAMVMSLYPATQKNPQLAQNVVGMFDQVMGGQVDEGWKDVVAGGAMALGALGAGAQTMPDINVQQVELANKYYNVLVQRAKEDGIKLDTRTLNVIKAKAQDAAAKKTQQSTYQQGFSGQGSERKVAKDAGQFESQGVAEGASLSVEQLAHISDKALDDAYHYGRSTPGANFGWMANMQSAKAAKRLIDAGETDIETISDAIHKGWNVTAAADYKGQLQLDTPTPDEKKLKRAKLAMQSYSQLPEEEKEKDRVVARALLTALRGKIDETQGLPYPSTYGQETEPLKSHGARRIVAMTNEDSNMSKSLDYLEEK